MSGFQRPFNRLASKANPITSIIATKPKDSGEGTSKNQILKQEEYKNIKIISTPSTIEDLQNYDICEFKDMRNSMKVPVVTSPFAEMNNSNSFGRINTTILTLQQIKEQQYRSRQKQSKTSSNKKVTKRLSVSLSKRNQGSCKKRKIQFQPHPNLLNIHEEPKQTRQKLKLHIYKKIAHNTKAH